MCKKTYDNKIIYLIIFIFGITVNCFAIGEILNLYNSAKPAGIQAYSAYSDMYAININPASTAFLNFSRVSSSIIHYPQNIKFYNITYFKNYKKVNLAFTLNSMSDNNIEKTYISGRDAVLAGYNVNYSSFLFTTNLSKKILNDLGVGINLSVLNTELDYYTAKTLVLDLGFLKKNIIEDCDISLSFKNLFGSLKFNNLKENINKNIILGLKYKFNYRLVLSSELQKIESDKNIYFKSGLNFKFDPDFDLRVGYSSYMDIDNGISFGIGYKNKIWGFDYAFIPYNEIGDLHFLTVFYNLEPPKKENKKNNNLVLKCPNCNHLLKSSKINYCPNCGYYLKNKTQNKKLIIKKQKEKIKKSNLSYEMLFNEAKRQFKLKKYPLTIVIIKKYLKIYPENIYALKILADSYYNLKDYDNAIKQYELIEKIGIK